MVARLEFVSAAAMVGKKEDSYMYTVGRYIYFNDKKYYD
jgi:hypothetical protein